MDGPWTDGIVVSISIVRFTVERVLNANRVRSCIINLLSGSTSKYMGRVWRIQESGFKSKKRDTMDLTTQPNYAEIV